MPKAPIKKLSPLGRHMQSASDEQKKTMSSSDPSKPPAATIAVDENDDDEKKSATEPGDTVQEEEIPPYTLRQHCHYLGLKTDTTISHSYWYCDWTSHFVQYRADLVKNVVKEYCQPFKTVAELQDLYLGISSLSEEAEDPLPVRTLSIRLRPDCQHYSILQAVHEAFTKLHYQQYQIVKSTPQTFQAIGGDGTTPFFISAFVVVHKTSLERRLLLRVYHFKTVPLPDEVLKKAQGFVSSKAPLRNEHTPLNRQLAEACVLVQYVLDGELTPAFPCPKNSQEEASRFFQTTYAPSISVLEENKSLSRHRDVYKIFPSLSNEDYDILQESYPLIQRIWSELELRKCTYNTLVEETYRFGMRPCQPTLDKEFCFQLSQISQQHMLIGLQEEIVKAESILHDTLGGYQEMETLLLYVMRRRYNIPHDLKAEALASVGVDVGQTPIRMSKRRFDEFPWHNDVKKALDGVSHQIAEGCLKAFVPIVSMEMADDAVHHVYTAFGKIDDMDQQEFLKKRNRQAMIRVSQQQAVLKRLLTKVIMAPMEWPGLPKLTSTVEMWYDISQQARTSNLRRNPVPITEFKTKLGQGCITAHQLILLTGFLTSQVYVYDWVDIDIQYTPTHRLTKISILENGKRVNGFNPTDVDARKLVDTIHVLKGLQEA